MGRRERRRSSGDGFDRFRIDHPQPTLPEVVPVEHNCALGPLPPEARKTPANFFAECPNCHHQLLVHSFTHPCNICALERRILMLLEGRDG